MNDNSLNDISKYRRMRERPTLIFINRIRDEILATGQPEAIEDLYRSEISKSEDFEILCPISIPRGIRPFQDRAPCPMCTPNKFYDGYLAYFPRLQAVGVIGHCCANERTLAEAVRKSKIRNTRDHEEGFLFENLPLLDHVVTRLNALSAQAREITERHKRFRTQAPDMLAYLRKIRSAGGMLSVTEEIDLAAGEGPRGFGQGGRMREITIGQLSGLPFLVSDFDPSRELTGVARQFRAVAEIRSSNSEEDALEFIVSLSDNERAAAYKKLKSAFKAYDVLRTKVNEAARFFEPKNLKTLEQWGAHPSNSQKLTLSEYDTDDGRLVILKGFRETARIEITRTSEKAFPVLQAT